MIKDKEYFCCKLSQRGQGNAVDFVIFVASSKDVNAWAGVKRVGEDKEGSQRVLKDTRVKAINRFLTKSIRNTIPVSAIVAFNPSVASFTSLGDSISPNINGDISNGINGKLDWGKIRFSFDDTLPDAEKPALIVDGQHRIRGMASVENEDIPVLIVGLIDATPEEQAFQFVVINNKSQKVPTDNVKAILRLIDQEELELSNRLRIAGVNYGKISATLGDVNEAENSPFKNLLKWPLTPNSGGFIDLTAIENCIRYIKSVLPIIKEDDESVKEIFLAMWRSIKSTYPELWAENQNELEDKAKSKFMSKVNISALNEFITDKVGNAWLDDKFDLFKMTEIENYCSDVVLKQIPSDFWKSEWTFNLQDNAVVRNRVKEDILRITQNVKSDKEWYEGLAVTQV